MKLETVLNSMRQHYDVVSLLDNLVIIGAATPEQIQAERQERIARLRRLAADLQEINTQGE